MEADPANCVGVRDTQQVMYKGHRIAIVIPAYNEERHLPQVLNSIPEFVDHIIVVDDASQDRTYDVALACGGPPRLLVLRSAHNQGVGGSTILGYRKAIELDSAIVVKMDGDGQMVPEFLEALIAPIVEQDFDYAKGNRFILGEFLSSMPTHRLLGNIVLTFLTKLASGYWNIFDPQNGYTAIQIDALRALNLDAIHQRFFFENDMLVHLNLNRRRVTDVAIPARYGEEISHLNPFKIGLTFPFLLLRRFFYRIYQKYVLRDFSPIALFLFLGLTLFTWGSFFGLYLWVESYLTGRFTPTGTIMLALLPLILGFQLLLQAIVLDIQETPK
jgi:glycosyltransferase involved in cell wall biosynthesis